jgi:chemotaxis protein MotB
MEGDAPKKGAPAWVVTFGDMMSLLLCFFVLLLSFSTMEMEKFKLVAGFVREAFGVQRKHHYTEIPSGQLMVAAGASEHSNWEKVTLFEKIKVLIDDAELESIVQVEIKGDGVRIRVEGGALFTSGTAAVQQEMTPFLESVARLARNGEDQLVVEGHTDDRPIHSQRYPSNWELSSARAGSVVRWLIEEGGVPPRRIQAVGYADTRPLAPNDSPEGRSRNRRVEILFETS